MIDPALRDSLASFDDAALAALANPGLVRRAHRDLEEGRVSLVASGTSSAEINADGQIVKIDLRGPRAAECACKSLAICRHRIAAVLFLLDQPADVPEVEGDPRDIADAIDPAALERWAGKANWRAALELADSAGAVEATPNALLVRFESLDDAVHILRGQSFDGIISKASPARRKAVHAAAALAALRHFGMGLPTPDVDIAETSDAVEISTSFLDGVAVALAEVAALGFNLAPVSLEESLFELSVSSRADSLPRLSAMLRAIAAQIRLRRQRLLAFDADAMLELTATAYALTRALRTATGDRRIALAGKVRRDFHPAPPLSLVGCGGERWRTIAGARGVTAYFIEPATGRWLSTTLARGPGQDPAFKPGEAWRHQTMWHAAPLATLAHAHFELTGASRSADDRLSAPATAQARVIAANVRPDAIGHHAVTGWAEIRPYFLRECGLGLDANATAIACLLAPTQIAAPYFDDFAQQLVWPLRDAHGQWLAVTLDHEEPVSTAFEALEASIRRGWKGMILAKISRKGEQLAMTPLTLFGEGEPVDLSLWQRPWSPRESKVRDWLERLRPAAAQRSFTKLPRSGTDATISRAWRTLLDRVEAGPGLAGSFNAKLAAEADRLETHGLPTLAKHLRQAREDRGALAAAYALCCARHQICDVSLIR